MKRSVPPDVNITTVVVEAVADVTGQSPETLGPIAESIDADAVESMFTRSASDGVERLEFTYEGCRVTVEPETVTVTEIPTAESSSVRLPD